MIKLFSDESRHATAALIDGIGSSSSYEAAPLLKGFEDFSNRMNRLAQVHGLRHSIQVTKRMQLHVTRYLANDPLHTNDLRIGLTKSGLPKGIANSMAESRVRLETKEADMVRIVLTVLNVSRLHLGDGKLDATSVVAPSTSIPEVEDSIIDGLVSSKGGIQLKGQMSKALRQEKWTEPHLTTKSGPNGQALGTALRDLVLLSNGHLEAIFVLGGPELKDYILRLKSLFSRIRQGVRKNVSDKSFLRRISVKPDKALKNRPIAILDYWSQCALLPLHKAIFVILESFTSDMTKNQLGIADRIGKGRSYHSLDLTSATDRFPISFQEKVLSFLVESKYAMAGKAIMVALPYYSNDSKQGYYYKAGQPMGAYSSWAVFALSHHIVVQSAAWETKQTEEFGHFTDYALLGDDIVIGNQKVADEYKRLMKGLGVELSDHKSHESTEFVEFAKNSGVRSQGKGENVTGVPLPGILSARDSPYTLATELSRLISRGTLRETNVSVSTALVRFVQLFYNAAGHAYSKRVLKHARIIADWLEVIETYNWVKQNKNAASPRSLHCNHSAAETYEFFQTLLLKELEEYVSTTQNSLAKNIHYAEKRMNMLHDQLMDEGAKGPERESLPDLSAIFYQPWYAVMESQVAKANDLWIRISSGTGLHAGQAWEDLIKDVSNLRVPDSKTIDARRISDIVLHRKRRTLARLMPGVKSL